MTNNPIPASRTQKIYGERTLLFFPRIQVQLLHLHGMDQKRESPHKRGKNEGLSRYVEGTISIQTSTYYE